MASIASTVERDPHYPGIIYAQRAPPEATGADAISLAARQIAETLKPVGHRLLHLVGHHRPARLARAAAGADPGAVADHRDRAPAFGRLGPALRRHRATPTDLDDMVNRACRIVVSEGFGKPGDRIIISAGVPLGTPGATNMLRIAYIGSDGQSGV